MYLELLNWFAVRYRWCYAPRYRLEVICLHKFGATQLLYGSVTLARCAALPYRQSWILPLAAGCLISEFLCTVLPSRILGVRRCGWTYVAALHVHLTLRTKRCSESVVASLLHLLLPCLPGTLGGQEAIHKKRQTLRCAFSLISDFLSSQAVSSQVLSAFTSLTTVFEMGTGGPSQLSPLNLSEFVL